ncbi:unnamed protein product [Lasius platythorax]|uniref:Uncharacterized protein n=1 Tax=Lasius platythorax TaxID=488582 RepID=A0AAV2P803_9HYME
MKIYVFALLIMITVAIALPIKDMYNNLEIKNEDKSLELQLAPAKEHHRELRVNLLCELLSGGFNQLALFVAFLKEKKGGRCTKDDVCLCRK